MGQALLVFRPKVALTHVTTTRALWGALFGGGLGQVSPSNRPKTNEGEWGGVVGGARGGPVKFGEK